MADDATGGGATGGSHGQASTQTNATATQATPEVFTKEQVESQTSAAVNAALRKHRDEQAAIIADKTKDAESRLAEVGKRAEEAEAKAAFAEEANSQGVTDIRAAYAVAKAEGLIQNGKPDWKKLQAEHPALFGKVTRTTAAGDKTDSSSKPNMTQLLRAAAGFGEPK